METKFPNTKKEFDSYSEENKRECIEQTTKFLMSEKLVEGSDVHNRMVERIKWFDDGSRDKIGNISWQKNRRGIMVFIDKFIEEEGMMPSVLEISGETGLSRTSVYKHLNALKSGEHLQEEMMVFKAQRGRFYAQVYKAAKTGSLPAIKLAKEIMESAQESESISYGVEEESKSNVKLKTA